MFPPKESILADSPALRSVRSLASVFVGILMAFLPKCPFCLAAYLSMFGSAGLALTPYIGWLYPVLIAFLVLHLLLLFQKAPGKGYGPFLFSLTGALIILVSRAFLPLNPVLTVSGIVLILSGSLWNSFSPGHSKRLLLNN
jgi:mercuric ion transport protein